MSTLKDLLIKGAKITGAQALNGAKFAGTQAAKGAKFTGKQLVSLYEKHNEKNKDKDDMACIVCKECGNKEQIDANLIAKILGTALVGGGVYAWVAFVFAGTGLALPICAAIVAGGVGVLNYKEEVGAWLAKQSYSCSKCGNKDWEVSTVKDDRFLEEKAELEHEKIELMQEIKDLNETLTRVKPVIYTTQDMPKVIEKLYLEAQKYIYISFGWYTYYFISEDLPLIKQAVERGVKLYFYYGIEPQKLKNGKYDPNSMKRWHKTLQVMNRLKEEFSEMTYIPVNTHQKIMLSEKCALVGSQNLFSYRPTEKQEDLREELTSMYRDEEVIEKYRQIITHQKQRNDMLRL